MNLFILFGTGTDKSFLLKKLVLSFTVILVSYTLSAQPNSQPLAQDDNISSQEDNSVLINVLANDSDPEGNIVPTPSVIQTPSSGTATVNNDGTITYTPNINFNGVDSFVYVICDSGNPPLCDTATVFVTVTSVPDQPVISIQPLVTGEDTTWYTCLPYTLDNTLDSVSVTITCQPKNGVLDTVYFFDGNICVFYAPELNYNGNDSFCIQLCDLSSGLCTTAVVPIVVNSVKDNCYWLKGFSPNGDGQNDFFYINCNDEYPDATLRVFNRWGDEVWRSEGHYTNNWYGRNMRDEVLPDGAYFFVYDFKNGSSKQHAGTIIINR